MNASEAFLTTVECWWSPARNRTLSVCKESDIAQHSTVSGRLQGIGQCRQCPLSRPMVGRRGEVSTSAHHEACAPAHQATAETFLCHTTPHGHDYCVPHTPFPHVLSMARHSSVRPPAGLPVHHSAFMLGTIDVTLFSDSVPRSYSYICPVPVGVLKACTTYSALLVRLFRYSVLNPTTQLGHVQAMGVDGKFRVQSPPKSSSNAIAAEWRVRPHIFITSPGWNS
jgi:hypothetical protein